MRTIDLRSDTTTRPVPAMRAAMAAAEVGDDVYREDPTINRLEEMTARITGKDASLFVSSGSMGNLISLYIEGGRGNEVLTHRESHIMLHEVGSPAAIAGVMPVGLDGSRGILDRRTIEAHLHPDDYTVSRATLIELENTKDGACYPIETLREIRACADEHQLKIHMDGARLFNAAVAQQQQISDICRYADSLSFCLSKGLGAPAGSMLCGSRSFIDQALKVRKMLGGGMRQIGILAAAGIYALEHHVERLAEDHAHAQQIAQALSQCSWASIDPELTETNIIFFDTPEVPSEQVVALLEKQGVLCFSTGWHTIRMVTHLDVSQEDTDRVVQVIKDLQVL
ncbi:MAG: low-specificity L-threonine aldolase [Spirochaetia bacterium]|nr:low-specificity L-threonine aldolase [Spirochaetia bacterium]